MTHPGQSLPDHEGLGPAVENAAFVLALRGRGLRDTAVLRAMEQVPRARFAPPAHRRLARRDLALPLPCGAAMAAPGTVAAMLTLLQVEAGQRVLEVGTGSGYAAALVARMGGRVTSLERYATLVRLARENLARETLARENRAQENLGEGAVAVVHGDGLTEAGEGAGGYDRILVHGAVVRPPPHWLAVLAPGGRIVAGSGGRLVCWTRAAGGIVAEPGTALHLVPLAPGRARVL